MKFNTDLNELEYSFHDAGALLLQSSSFGATTNKRNPMHNSNNSRETLVDSFLSLSFVIFDFNSNFHCIYYPYGKPIFACVSFALCYWHTAPDAASYSCFIFVISQLPESLLVFSFA